MTEQVGYTQEERRLAALAHGGIVLSPLTNGIAGTLIALVIWLVQRGKSAYVTAQAFQALVYQVIAMVAVMLCWCIWTVVYVALTVIPLAANPGAYEELPPTGFFVGLGLIVLPLAFGALTIVYGLVGAVRCLRGRPFSYVLLGRWLSSQHEGGAG